MSIISKIEVITTEVWESLVKEYTTTNEKQAPVKLVLIPASNKLEKVRDQLQEEEPNFSIIWKYLKSYLSFPYQQMIPDDTTHVESQIIERIGTIYSILGNAKNKVVANFITTEINSSLEIFRKTKGGEALDDFLVPLSIEQVLERIILKEEYDEYLKSLGYELENGLTLLIIKTTEDNELSPNPLINNLSDEIRETMVEKHRFLILYELGVFECLKNKWKLSNVTSDRLGESELDYNVTSFAKLIAEIFKFEKHDNIRSDYSKMKIVKDSQYDDNKRNKILAKIASFGIEKKSLE